MQPYWNFGVDLLMARHSMPTTGAIFVTNPLAVRINRGHPRWRAAERNALYAKFSVPSFKALRAKHNIPAGTPIPQSVLEERFALTRKAKGILKGITGDKTSRVGHRKGHTKHLTGQARFWTGKARKTHTTRGGKPTRLSVSDGRPPWMAGYKTRSTGAGVKSRGRKKAAQTAQAVANPLYRTLSGIAYRVNPMYRTLGGIAYKVNPMYRTLGGIAVRANPGVALPGTALVQRGLAKAGPIGSIAGQALPASLGLVLGLIGYGVYQMSPLPGWVSAGVEKVVGMLPDAVEAPVQKGINALGHISGTLTGSTLAFAIYKVNGATVKSTIANQVATAVAVAGITVDLVRAISPLLARWNIKLPLSGVEGGESYNALAFSDGMAYEVVPLGAEDVEALQGIAVAYSDAALGDAWYAGQDFSVDEGESLLAGPQVWRERFQPAINRTRAPGAMHSRHAGQAGHKWAWLIKWVGWENAVRLAKLPPEERKQALDQIRAAAMASATQVTQAGSVKSEGAVDSAYAGVVGSFGDPQFGGFVYTGQGA